MLPTLADSGELVFESCFAYRFSPVARGDIVTLKSPLDPQRIVCKRVIGLPGDIICVDPTGEMAPSSEHVVVAKGHVWISGDNAAASRDSRMYGPVSMSLIQAKLVARVSQTLLVHPFTNATTTGLASASVYNVPQPNNSYQLGRHKFFPLHLTKQNTRKFCDWSP